jgi:hypothetical protein
MRAEALKLLGKKHIFHYPPPGMVSWMLHQKYKETKQKEKLDFIKTKNFCAL